LIRPLLFEKVPLFALAAISSIITYLVQQHGEALTSVESLPLATRMANAFVSYITYMAKMLWPTNLAILYPHPMGWPVWSVLGSVALLVALTALAISGKEKHPYGAVGWLWYIGTLVPAIGIVQVGPQALADRYTYIPLIGLFLIVAWGVPELLVTWPQRKEAFVILAALCFSILFFLTWRQAGYWQNSITLYDHTLAITDHNRAIYNNRGSAYMTLGNYAQALQDFGKAIEINPGHERAYFNRGLVYNKLADYTRAVPDFTRAIEINPKYVRAYFSRGIAYGSLGDHERAIQDMKTAARLGHESARNVLRSQGLAWQ
jgi:tetratricopeptide (TPR) repeat protein